MPAREPRDGAPAWRSWWMAGFEGADHLNSRGVPLDMNQASGHLQRLNQDYAKAVRLGFRTVRESVGWRLAEPAPGCFDWSRVRRTVRVARRHGVQVLWTLMHYGLPPDLDYGSPELSGRLARFAVAFARELAALGETGNVCTPVNEIGFTAWAASQTGLFAGRGNSGGAAGSSFESGFEIKRNLVCACIAAMQAIREVDRDARFLHVEPVVHVAAPADRPDLDGLASRICGYQWQAWDMLAGIIEPQLGGAPHWLDCVGVNHYHSGQWEAGTERRLDWFARDPRRRPFRELLAECWTRYGRPMIVAETSHVGAGRAAWLHEIAGEVRAAREAGVPVTGLCLYPFVDRPDWDDAAHWHRSGVFDVRADTDSRRPCRRLPNQSYVRAIRAWQDATSIHKERPMSHLIVFCHLRWDFVFQRPQQVLWRLAERYRIHYVEEPLHADGKPRLERMTRGPGIDVLRPCTPLQVPGFHDEQLPLLQPLLADYFRAQGIKDCIAWTYTPMALPLIAQLEPRAVVYDCMDELSAFKDAPRQLRQRENALLKMARLVFAGGPALYDAKRAVHPNVHCLPSGVDAGHFSPGRLSAHSAENERAHGIQGALPRPRLGYFGVIDERLDTGLLAHLAAERPHWQFIMVGPVVKIDPAQLPRGPNIHWLGQQPYELLPHLLAGWDVALLPFALNDATRFISPTKTLEYLAGGKPVVSTAIADVIRLYGDAVSVAGDPAQFLEACDRALLESPQAAMQRHSSGAALVASHSWDSIAAAMLDRLEAELQATEAPASPQAGAAESAPAAAGVVHPSPRRPRQWKHVIAGAGPTGLAAAYYLGLAGDGPQTLLLEREKQVGGWCRSLEAGGFTFDHAGHIMFSNDPEVLRLYQLLLGDNLHWQNREAWVYSKGVYTRYPFQGSLHGLPPQVLKECIVGAIEARFGPLRGGGTGGSGVHAGARPRPANFEEFILGVWGEGIARHFAIPYNRKLWTVPLDEMETSWLEGRVPLPDLEQIIEGALEHTPRPMGPNARFGYPLRGGFQALMTGFLPHLQCELATEATVVSVSPSRRMLRLADGRVIRFETLVSTMPLPRLVEACGDEAPAEVQTAARALRHVAVRCVHLGVARSGLTDKHWIYYPEDTVFHRIFVQGNASPHVNPPGGFGLTCEITHSAAKPLPCEGDELVRRVVDDCRRVGMLQPDDRIAVSAQVDMPCAYVVYDHARSGNVERIRRWLEPFSIILAGRYSEWEYYNSDHAFVAGRRAAAEAGQRSAAVDLASAG